MMRQTTICELLNTPCTDTCDMNTCTVEQDQSNSMQQICDGLSRFLEMPIELRKMVYEELYNENPRLLLPVTEVSSETRQEVLPVLVQGGIEFRVGFDIQYAESGCGFEQNLRCVVLNFLAADQEDLFPESRLDSLPQYIYDNIRTLQLLVHDFEGCHPWVVKLCFSDIGATIDVDVFSDPDYPNCPYVKYGESLRYTLQTEIELWEGEADISPLRLSKSLLDVLFSHVRHFQLVLEMWYEAHPE